MDNFEIGPIIIIVLSMTTFIRGWIRIRRERLPRYEFIPLWLFSGGMLSLGVIYGTEIVDRSPQAALWALSVVGMSIVSEIAIAAHRKFKRPNA